MKFKLLMLMVLVSYSGPGISSQVKDKFIFKLAGEVFSLSDLKSYYAKGRSLHCIFSDSLLYKVYPNILDLSHEGNFNFQPKLSSSQKKYFSEFIGMGKLIIYIRSHNVDIGPSIKKYFHFLSKKKDCGKELFLTNGEMEQKFEEITKIEVFLRGRFLPAEIQGKATDKDMEKAIVSAKSLIKSINGQIDQEVYW